MADLYLQYRPRRLPVFFLLDTSQALDGTFQVTMQDGLLVIKREVVQHVLGGQHVYVSSITFGEQTRDHGLVPLDNFTPPIWQAQGQCLLKPALESLMDALKFDLLTSRPDRPGDYAPLVFLVLGGTPSDAWEEKVEELKSFTDNQRPLIVALVSRPELVGKIRMLTNSVLLLQPAEAASMTYFFFWVARVITKVCEDCLRGASSINFPELPYGVIMPPSGT